MGIVDTADKKGFTVVYKKAKSANKPAKATVRCTMKAGARRSLYKLKRLLTKNKYRVDLTKVHWLRNKLWFVCGEFLKFVNVKCIVSRLPCVAPVLYSVPKSLYLLKRHTRPKRLINLCTLINVWFNVSLREWRVLQRRFVQALLGSFNHVYYYRCKRCKL